MTVEIFIMLLTAFSVLTGLVTEAIKKVADEWSKKIAPNTTAFVVACLIGWIGMCFFYIIMQIPYSAQTIAALVLMGPASAISAMVGYDKLVQAIKQIKG